MSSLFSVDGTGIDTRWLLPNPKSGRPMRKEAAALGLNSKMKYNATQPARLCIQFGWSAACIGGTTPAGGAFFIGGLHRTVKAC